MKFFEFHDGVSIKKEMSNVTKFKKTIKFELILQMKVLSEVKRKDFYRGSQ